MSYAIFVRVDGFFLGYRRVILSTEKGLIRDWVSGEVDLTKIKEDEVYEFVHKYVRGIGWVIKEIRSSLGLSMDKWINLNYHSILNMREVSKEVTSEIAEVQISAHGKGMRVFENSELLEESVPGITYLKGDYVGYFEDGKLIAVTR